MRLRVARKVVIAWKAATARLNLSDISDGPHREGTTIEAFRRIHVVQRRHFPTPVLRPIRHRKRWEWLERERAWIDRWED